MARLRHFAVVVKDLERSARFYESVFDLRNVGREDLDIGSAIYMTDGVINLALLNFKGKEGSDLADAKSFVGAHHFGFQVDDLAETQRRIESAGGKFFFDLGDERKGNFERKFKDPDGVIFDITPRLGWHGQRNPLIRPDRMRLPAWPGRPGHAASMPGRETISRTRWCRVRRQASSFG